MPTDTEDGPRIESSKKAGIENGWFSELESMWPGQKFSLALEEFSASKSVLFHKDSGYQNILVFRSAQYGNVLVLDGVIQMTQRDEFAFHEMIAHPALCSHPNPQSVCIVGGGDGGVLRQVCRHACLEKITLIEIDPMVTAVAQEYFGKETQAAFQDPRLTIVQADAADYMGGCEEMFDIIISDSNDPVGPAKRLFEPNFYENMYKALKEGGIVCVQAESFWIHLDLISDLVACSREIFDHAEYASTLVPTYPCGQIGFILAGKRTRAGHCRVPLRTPSFVHDLQWYNPRIHRAAFVLPSFVEQRLEQHVDEEDSEINQCFLDRCTVS